MKKVTSMTAVALSALTIGGCASTQTSCALNNETGYCASVEDVYSAARSNGGDTENVMAGHASHDPNAMQRGTAHPAHADPMFDPGPGLGLAGPIYIPAEPRRLWVAPWTDANGVVHSGEYLYFLRPGQWRYGPLTAPGSAAGVLGPVAPEDLGFNPSAAAELDPDDPTQTVAPGRRYGTTSDEVFPVSHGGGR